MALRVPDQAENTMLEIIVNKTAAQDLELRLYSNNATPSESDIASDYTEVSGGGYAGISLSGASWSVSASRASYAQQTFTFSGAVGNVYGYYLTQVGSGKIMWAERFTNGPYNIQNSGDTIKITPTISLE